MEGKMTRGSGQIGGPRLRAVDPWLPGNAWRGRSHQLLSDEERARLTKVASVIRFKKGEQVYAAGESTKAIFNIISGVVKIYSDKRDGSEYVVSFLHPEDLFGLSEEGRYVNSAKAITTVTAYLLSPQALRRLSKDADLEFHLIAKLCHELRQAQRHALLLAERNALSKLAMFLQLQEHVQSTSEVPSEVYLPMSRSDIAEYVSLSLAAVSRGFHTLVARRVIQYRNRRHVKIIDRKAFDMLAGGAGAAR